MDHVHQGVQHLRHRHTQVRGLAFASCLWDFPDQNTSGTRWRTPWQLLPFAARTDYGLSLSKLCSADIRIPQLSCPCGSRSFNLLNQRQDVQFLLLSNVNATAGFVNANVIVRSSLSACVT